MHFDTTQAPALALLAAQPPLPPIASRLMLVGAIIAAVRQKHAIGGWLFFFFWQVVAGCAVTIAFTDWSDLSAHAWNDQSRYFVFLLATAPRVAVLVTIAVLGVMLIRTYEWRWVITIKYTLTIYVIFGCLSVVADVTYFPARTAADAGTLIFPAVYIIYFNISTRVQSVSLIVILNSMATNSFKAEVINAAIEGFELQKSRIDAQIAELRQMLAGASAETAAISAGRATTRRKMSAAARKRMSEAQQKRWAPSKGDAAPVKAAAKPKRRISEEGRANIVAALKKRWAAKKAGSSVARKAAPKKVASRTTAKTA